ALLNGVIDYAGLFPPAQLPLDQAFTKYLAYRDCPDSWMLGRFVIPATRLGELTAFGAQVRSVMSPLSLTILGRGGDTRHDLLAVFDADLAAISEFCTTFPTQVSAESIEVRLPSSTDLESSVSESVDTIHRRGPNLKELFFEGPTAADWRTHDANLIAAL